MRRALRPRSLHEIRAVVGARAAITGALVLAFFAYTTPVWAQTVTRDQGAAVASAGGGALAASLPAPAPTARAAPRMPLRMAIATRAVLAPELKGLDAQATPGAATGGPDLTPVEADGVAGKWWFWTAVGGVVVLTAALIIISTRGEDVPKTKLMNMEAFR